MFPHAGPKEIALWLRRQRRRFRVEGNSMEPILREGDEILVDLDVQVRPGDLVVAKHPKRPEFMVVKQWDEKGLKSLCHEECSLSKGRVFGVVTSVL